MKSTYRDYYIAALIVFVFSFLALQINLSSQKFFRRDEANWSRVSIYAFKTFFVEQNFTDDGWGKSFNTFGFYNPQIGKYIIGASMWLHKFRSFNGVATWEADKSFEWHIEQGIVPSAEELTAARLPITLLASGTAVLLFILGSLLAASFSKKIAISMGLLTALLFFLHPITWQLSHQAMLDLPALFFTTFALTTFLLSSRRFMQGSAAQGMGWGGVTSLLLGLGIATKLNALLVWGVIFSCTIGLTVYFFHKKQAAIAKRTLFLLAAYIVIPFMIFVASNPFLYQDTFTGIERMVALNSLVSNKQGHLGTPLEKINAFTDLGIGFVRDGSQTKLLDALLLLGGSVLIPIWLVKKKGDKQFVVTAVILLFWALAMGIGLLLWIPRPWERYYLPWMPASALLEAFAILGTLLLLKKRSF